MATETNDTRALTAALEAPTPFRTLVGSAALHAAERHVDRWAPEIAAFPIYCFLGAGAIVAALLSHGVVRAVAGRLRQPALPASVPNLQS